MKEPGGNTPPESPKKPEVLDDTIQEISRSPKSADSPIIVSSTKVIKSPLSSTERQDSPKPTVIRDALALVEENKKQIEQESTKISPKSSPKNLHDENTLKEAKDMKQKNFTVGDDNEVVDSEEVVGSDSESGSIISKHKHKKKKKSNKTGDKYHEKKDKKDKKEKKEAKKKKKIKKDSIYDDLEDSASDFKHDSDKFSSPVTMVGCKKELTEMDLRDEAIKPGVTSAPPSVQINYNSPSYTAPITVPTNTLHHGYGSTSTSTGVPVPFNVNVPPPGFAHYTQPE